MQWEGFHPWSERELLSTNSIHSLYFTRYDLIQHFIPIFQYQLLIKRKWFEMQNKWHWRENEGYASDRKKYFEFKIRCLATTCSNTNDDKSFSEMHIDTLTKVPHVTSQGDQTTALTHWKLKLNLQGVPLAKKDALLTPQPGPLKMPEWTGKLLSVCISYAVCLYKLIICCLPVSRTTCFLAIELAMWKTAQNL